MPRRHSISFFNIIPVIVTTLAVSACRHAEAVNNQPVPQVAASVTPSPAASPAPEAAVTREKASTDCWMKYEKKGGRSVSINGCRWWRNAPRTN